MTACSLTLPFTPIFGLAALIAAPAPALADVTAQDVWQAFSAQLSAYGTLQADVAQAGGTLSARNVVLSSRFDGLRSDTVRFGAISFRENGDGTVAIDFPAQITGTLRLSGIGAQPANIGYSFAQQGMQVTASGDKGNITHDFVAPKMSYRVDGLTVNGQNMTGDMSGEMQLDLEGAKGSWQHAGTSQTRMTADYTIDAATLDAAFASPGSRDQIKLTANMADLAAQSDSTLPQGLQNMTPQAMFASGFDVAGGLSYGTVRFAADVTAQGQNIEAVGRVEQGRLEVAVNGDQLRYATKAQQVDISGGLAGLPLPPVELHFDTSRFDLLAPLSQADAPQGFALGIGLKGLTVSDFLWSFIDPGQQLPRDPADVEMDLKGTGSWLVDIFNPDALAAANGAPGTLNSLSLETLDVSVAGASLTGDGAFVFDNTDLVSFGGLPRPEGDLDLTLTGGVTLLDRLTAINLVPRGQAGMVKAMLGLFTKPGPGVDTLTSKIAIDPAGRILANGQPLQ